MFRFVIICSNCHNHILPKAKISNEENNTPVAVGVGSAHAHAAVKSEKKLSRARRSKVGLEKIDLEEAGGKAVIKKKSAGSFGGAKIQTGLTVSQSRQLASRTNR